MHYFGTIETSENGDIIGIGDYHVAELSKEAQMFVGGVNYPPAEASGLATLQ